MQLKSYHFLLLVLALGALSAFLFQQSRPKYGLDVKGGVEITYQVDTSKLTNEMKAKEGEWSGRVQQILENRVASALGVVEGQVYRKGRDQFVVELPGYTNADEAKRVLGTSASLKCYHAKTVRTPKRPYRNYESISSEGKPEVRFRHFDKEIAPGMPEYVEMIKGWDLILQGDDLESSKPDPTGISGYRPEMTFSNAGARKMEDWTRRYKDEEENIAFVLDDVVLSIAPLKKGQILRDNAVIDGNYKLEYVKQLTDLLNSGALPVDLILLSSRNTVPTIGSFALSQIITAGAIAFGLISLFLIVYYAVPGVMAFVALMLYILFTLTVLKLINATFSLAGIAGFILSVGMAVDANILVFERFKEEMRSGKALKSAMELGFRRALPAIIDSNACTIITSIVLMELGTGPVKGFATTLVIGVAISLFTAVFVTRSLLMFLVGSGFANDHKWYAVNHEWFGKRFQPGAEPLTVVEKSKRWFLLSGITILIGVPFAFIGGFKLNVEFRGGAEASFTHVDATMTREQIATNLDRAGFKGANIKFSSEPGGQRLVSLTLPQSPQFLEADGKPRSDEKVLDDIAVAAGVARHHQDPTGKDFTDKDTFGSVGPVIRGETISNAIWGVILSSSLIIIYLAFRFGFAVGGFVPGLKFGVSAIGALIHDILVVIFLAAVVGYFEHWEISALFITAMLTIIGFSVHDTIVIFDRIRENLRRPNKGEAFSTLMNRSITQSFARSINTSMTVVATLLILVLFGTPTVDLKFFCVAMLVGIVSGTYSSIYNASPILYLWDLALARKKGEAATLVGMAQAENVRSRVISTRAPEVGQPTPATPAGRTYGQVRRRASDAQTRGQRELDDEP